MLAKLRLGPLRKPKNHPFKVVSVHFNQTVHRFQGVILYLCCIRVASLAMSVLGRYDRAFDEGVYACSYHFKGLPKSILENLESFR